MIRLSPIPAAPCPRRSPWIVALPLAALSIAGCRAPEPAPPFTGPRLGSSLRYFRGSPLSGPQAAPGKIDTQDLCPFRVEAIALESWKPETMGGQALGSLARLLAVPQGDSPVKPLPRLTSAARIVEGRGSNGVVATLESGQVGRSVPIGSAVRGALPAGVTAIYELKAAVPSGGRAEVHLHRRAVKSGDEIDVALLLLDRPTIEDDRIAQDSRNPAAEPTTAQRKGPYEREIAVLDPIPAGTERSIAIFVPSPFEGEACEAVAFAISTGPTGPHDSTGGAAQDPEVARAMAILEQAAVSPAASEGETGTPFAAGLPPAFEAIASPPTRKNAVLLLAGETGSLLTEDFALTADYDQLNAYCELLIRKATAAVAEKPLDAPGLAFVLESTCVEHLTALLSKDKLPGELQAVLLKHAGQAARQASSLEEAVKTSKTVEALRSRISEENWIALEDSLPPARVRAFDWLNARGEAPQGFDPLAASKERRTALEKAISAKLGATNTSAPRSESPAN